jgi:hypothetical protein
VTLPVSAFALRCEGADWNEASMEPTSDEARTWPASDVSEIGAVSASTRTLSERGTHGHAEGDRRRLLVKA